MNITRKALTTLGGVFLAALLLAALAPRAARGVAAALVQIGHNERVLFKMCYSTPFSSIAWPKARRLLTKAGMPSPMNTMEPASGLDQE
jgi:hypothetical protein